VYPLFSRPASRAATASMDWIRTITWHGRLRIIVR
jgi:hypothetical protein